MADWDKVAIAALKELGADSVMVPGAKLRQKMVHVGYLAGFDVAAHVALSTLSFSQLVADVEGVVVQPQFGSDVLVGLADAKVPGEATGSPTDRHMRLRRDVYEAFARLSATPFAYVPDRDTFVPEDRAGVDGIKVPPVTLDALLADRRRFIASLPSDRQRAPLDALASSPKPLAAFRTAISAAGMLDRWQAAHAKTVVDRARQWAGANGVRPRDAWFRSETRSPSTHQVLARLVPYLTTDEIRNLSIPFRAVEAMLSDVDGQ